MTPCPILADLAMIVGPDLAPFLACGTGVSIKDGVSDQLRIEYRASQAVSAHRVKRKVGRVYQAVLRSGRDADIAVYLDGVRI